MNGIDPTTARYIASVQTIAALSREEELALSRAYHAGDEAAGQRVLSANLRHVVPHALRYRSLGVPVAELIAQGNLGLTLALRRFDPNRGLRFATYANHWVRSEMLALALRMKTMVGGGRGPLRGKYAVRMRREHARLLSRLGNEAEVRSVLSQRYGKTPEEIALILYRNDVRDASLDAGSRFGERALMDDLPSGTLDQDAALADAQARSRVESEVSRALVGLSERERYVVEHRMMADPEARLSLAEIGQRFGISRERARQVESRIKSRLRSRLQGLGDALPVSVPSAAA